MIPDELGLLAELPPVIREALLTLLYPFAWVISQVMYRLLQLGVIVVGEVGKELYWDEIRTRQAP